MREGARTPTPKGPAGAPYGTPSQNCDAEGLGLQVCVDAGPGTLASQARLFRAAEGRHSGQNGAGVHADHAEFQRLGHAEGAGHVSRAERRGQSAGRAAGQGKGLILGREAEQGANGAKALLGQQQHVGGGVGQDRGGGVLLVGRVSAGGGGRALGNGIGDMCGDLLQGLAIVISPI